AFMNALENRQALPAHRSSPMTRLITVARNSAFDRLRAGRTDDDGRSKVAELDARAPTPEEATMLAAEFVLGLLRGQDHAAGACAAVGADFARAVTEWERQCAAFSDDLEENAPRAAAEARLMLGLFAPDPAPAPAPGLLGRLWRGRARHTSCLWWRSLGQAGSGTGRVCPGHSTAPICPLEGDFPVVAIDAKTTNQVALTWLSGAAPPRVS
ncbi:MAG: hypothetical protein AAF761_08685, partial [Pseudomonadota bacterium]